MSLLRTRFLPDNLFSALRRSKWINKHMRNVKEEMLKWVTSCVTAMQRVSCLMHFNEASWIPAGAADFASESHTAAWRCQWASTVRPTHICKWAWRESRLLLPTAADQNASECAHDNQPGDVRWSSFIGTCEDKMKHSVTWPLADAIMRQPAGDPSVAFNTELESIKLYL